MSARSRRILGWVVLVAGFVVLGYVVLTGALIVRGDLEAGPVRLTTMVLNVVAGVGLLYLARLTLRSGPPGR
jgi:hypothetical protein